MGSRLVGLVVAVVLLYGLQGELEAGSYNFTKIADSTGPLQFFGHDLAINNGGTAAFWASKYSGTDVFPEAISAGNGGAITTIADTDGPFFTFQTFFSPAINDSGKVAFSALLDSHPTQGIFVGSGDAITTRAASRGRAR